MTSTAAAASNGAIRRVGVALGTMEFGRYASEADALRMTELFLAAGHRELDTARMYCKGETERIIGRFPAAVKARITMDTKANPWGTTPPELGLSYASVLEQLNASLTSLQLTPDAAAPPVDIFYLHAPDHSTPIMDTLRAVQELYAQGKFSRFGLSNFSSWQVMNIYHLCTQHKYVLPAVYQGMYNALTRAVEPELFPCLRQLGMSYMAYNPLAGGLLTGKYRSFHELPAEPGRFQGNDWAERYRQRFWRESVFNSIAAVSATLPAGMEMTEASLRWLLHHSALKGEMGDGLILGASTVAHLEKNLQAVQGGPLPADVVAAFDRAWELCKGDCPAYFR